MKLFFIFILLFSLLLFSEEVTIRVDMVESWDVNSDSTLIYLYQTFTVNQTIWTDTIFVTKQDIQNEAKLIDQQIKQIRIRQSELSAEFSENYNKLDEIIKQLDDRIKYWSEKYSRLK